MVFSDFVRFSPADFWFALRASAPFARPRIARTASSVASFSATCNRSPRSPTQLLLHLMHLHPHSPLRQTAARKVPNGIRRRRRIPPPRRPRQCVLYMRSLPLAGRRNPDSSKSRTTLHCCCMTTMTFSRRSLVAAMCSRSIGCVWYASCTKIFSDIATISAAFSVRHHITAACLDRLFIPYFFEIYSPTIFCRSAMCTRAIWRARTRSLPPTRVCFSSPPPPPHHRHPQPPLPHPLSQTLTQSHDHSWR
jgi:hypothetical protein